MKIVHWIMVAVVLVCIVALPLWFSVRGVAGQPFYPISAKATDASAQGGNLRSNGTRVFVGGGSRTGK